MTHLHHTTGDMLPGKHDWNLSVTKLLLGNNKLVYLHGNSFAKLFKLRHLDLSNNQIELIQKSTFQALTSLLHLNLTANRLSSLSSANWLTVLGASLRRLDVSKNDIYTVSGRVLGHLKRLELLDLSSNHIKALADATFDGLQRLKWLFLEHNSMEKAPLLKLQTHLESLEEIDLSWNNLKEIEKFTFKNSRSLKYVRISCNRRLRVVEEEAFSNLTSLETVEVAQNHKLLYVSWKAFSNCPSIKHVNFRANAFSSIEEAFITSHQLRLLDVSDNPLRCDCVSAWPSEWLKQGQLLLDGVVSQLLVNQTTVRKGVGSGYVEAVRRDGGTSDSGDGGGGARASSGFSSVRGGDSNGFIGFFKDDLKRRHGSSHMVLLNAQRTRCFFGKDHKRHQQHVTINGTTSNDQKAIVLTDFVLSKKPNFCPPRIIEELFEKVVRVKMVEALRVYCLATGAPPASSHWTTLAPSPPSQV